MAVGTAAVDFALEGRNATMPVIRRISSAPYVWDIAAASLDAIANQEKKLPAAYIRTDGYGITAAARRYLEPLIQGEVPPPYKRSGLPDYVTLKNVAVPKKLPAWDASAA
jgi:ATP-dependent phosphofructokinase / diphosphate-dependent phosphofructokinase